MKNYTFLKWFIVVLFLGVSSCAPMMPQREEQPSDAVSRDMIIPGGVGGAGNGDITAVGDASTGDVFTADGTGNTLYFEGATPDDYETLLTADDTTGSDKTITLPNETGTVITSTTTLVGDVTGTPGATVESDPNALLTAGTDNIKDTHIDWGSGAGQVDADDIGDGSTNAIVTLTQETNFETAYTHSQDNTQAHSDYVLNTGTDTLGSGSGFALTFDAGTTDPVFTFGDGTLSLTGINAFTLQPTSDSTTGFQILDADGGTPILSIDTTNERVGIGMDTPLYPFHITGNAGFIGSILISQGNTGVFDATSATYGIRPRNASNQMEVRTNGTTQMLIPSTGEATFTAGIVPASKTADPCGSGFPESAIFYNSTAHTWCGCDGTNDIKLSDGSACF